MRIKIADKTKKRLTYGALLLATTVTLSGCSLFDRSEVTSPTGVVIETNVNNLEEDTYYTYNGKEYGKLYIGDRTFKSSSTISTSKTGNPSNVIWLQDDINNIPVMRRGDKIVYHSSSNLVSYLSIERFYDLGYSIGIAGLQADDTGRYTLSLSESSLTIDPTSDAKSLQAISSNDDVVIDSIGKAPLRSGNVSESGTIIGLEKDKTYAINAYLGTNLHKTNVKADVRILASSEGDEITNYEFSESKTVEFSFPVYYNSGYYLVNGYGLVKYIADDTAANDENLDMNVPNIYPEAGEEGEDVSQKNFNAEDLTTATIKVETDGEQTITITYGNSDNEKTTAPIAKLISEDGAHAFEAGDNNTLTLKTTLPKGEYEVQIIGLNGRTYSYRVKSKDAPATESESTTSSSTESSKSLADIVNGN